MMIYKFLTIFMLGATFAAPFDLWRSKSALADAASVNAATSISVPSSSNHVSAPSTSSQPRFFCDQTGSSPRIMARRSDGFAGPIIDWSAPWTSLSNPLTPNQRCEEVANRLRLIQSRNSSFRITAGQFSQQPALCVALERGVCASDGLIMTTRSIQAAEEGVRALETAFQQIASVKDPFSTSSPQRTEISDSGEQIAAVPNISTDMGGSTLSSATTPHVISTSTDPVTVALNFSFQNVLEYSDCLEDIIRLYQNPVQLEQRGRRSNCLPEVFSTYETTGLSQSQALEVIKAADQYALNASAGRWLFPPAGLRIRVQQLFGFIYEIDAQR